jgi:tyramine---L-glutamate ligase
MNFMGSVAVLEWICGGGCIDSNSSGMPSILAEGWAMLYSAVTQLDRIGIDTLVSIDATRISKHQIDQLPKQCQVYSHYDNKEIVPSNWKDIANVADQLLIIAPEFSGILQNAVEQFAAHRHRVCNCQGPFLAASCDKWLTATCFESSNILCPPSLLLPQVSTDWLDKHRTQDGRWIIKPRDGAGCSGIEITDEDCLATRMTDNERLATNPSNFLIQPFVSGPSYSRSAIVDPTGKAHWMPLVTQHFSTANEMQYLGGQVLTEDQGYFRDPVAERSFAVAELDQLLNRAIRSLGDGGLGWIGLDLVYSVEQDKWLVVEVNPRLTTSFIGLSAVVRESMMEQMLRACRGESVQLTFTNRPVHFNANGS